MSLDSIEGAPSPAGLATERIYSAKRHIPGRMCQANTSEDGWTPSEKRGPENVDDFSGWQLSGVACSARLMTIPGLIEGVVIL